MTPEGNEGEFVGENKEEENYGSLLVYMLQLSSSFKKKKKIMVKRPLVCFRGLEVVLHCLLLQKEGREGRQK